MSHRNLRQEKGIEIALAYLREVKNRCKKPRIFNEFCETMRSFKRKEISESICHDVVKKLFKDDPELLEGFYIYFPRQKTSLLIQSSSITCITTLQQREVEGKNDVLLEVDNKENNNMNIDNQNIVVDNIENENNLRENDVIISNEGEKSKMMIINQESENISNINQSVKTTFINEFCKNFHSPKQESSDLSTVISSSFSPLPSSQSSFKNAEGFEETYNNNISNISSSLSTKKKEITSPPASNSLETGLRRSTRNRKTASKPVDDAYVFYK